jgi:hypothetical protein
VQRRADGGELTAGGVVPLLAVVAACLVGLVVAFQITLAAGAP